MRYSLIIPVYNAEATLRRCLDSILLQAFEDYELLLINDGSTDGSDAICREYAATFPRIKYLAKENGGVSSARNLGLEQAKGEYILFVDSDDYVSGDYFSTINDNVENSGPDLLMFGYRNFGSRSAAWSTGEFVETEEERVAQKIAYAMRRYLLSSLWSKAFKREIIRQHGLRFDNDLSIGEDQLFVFGYAMHINSVISINDFLYNEDISDGSSLSRKRRDYLTAQLMEGNRRMADSLRTSEHSEQARKTYEAALAWMSYRSAYSCCKELLKYDYTGKRRRQEIRKICKLYRDEKIRPRDRKCRVIALPVRLGMSSVVDFLINRKA